MSFRRGGSSSQRSIFDGGFDDAGGDSSDRDIMSMDLPDSEVFDESTFVSSSSSSESSWLKTLAYGSLAVVAVAAVATVGYAALTTSTMSSKERRSLATASAQRKAEAAAKEEAERKMQQDLALRQRQQQQAAAAGRGLRGMPARGAAGAAAGAAAAAGAGGPGSARSKQMEALERARQKAKAEGKQIVAQLEQHMAAGALDKARELLVRVQAEKKETAVGEAQLLSYALEFAAYGQTQVAVELTRSVMVAIAPQLELGELQMVDQARAVKAHNERMQGAMLKLSSATKQGNAELINLHQRQVANLQEQEGKLKQMLEPQAHQLEVQSVLFRCCRQALLFIAGDCAGGGEDRKAAVEAFRYVKALDLARERKNKIKTDEVAKKPTNLGRAVREEIQEKNPGLSPVELNARAKAEADALTAKTRKDPASTRARIVELGQRSRKIIARELEQSVELRDLQGPRMIHDNMLSKTVEARGHTVVGTMRNGRKLAIPNVNSRTLRLKLFR